jgi:hypothetical protein
LNPRFFVDLMEPGGAVRAFPVDADEVTIGRLIDSEARARLGDFRRVDINLDSDSLSPVHVRLVHRSDVFVAVDLRSDNGVAIFVCGAWHRITSPQIVWPGQPIRLGDLHVKLRRAHPSPAQLAAFRATALTARVDRLFGPEAADTWPLAAWHAAGRDTVAFTLYERGPFRWVQHGSVALLIVDGAWRCCRDVAAVRAALDTGVPGAEDTEALLQTVATLLGGDVFTHVSPPATCHVGPWLEPPHQLGTTLRFVVHNIERAVVVAVDTETLACELRDGPTGRVYLDIDA